MAKALEQELFNYIMQLDEAEKKSVLQMLKTFLKGRPKKNAGVSLEQYNQDIDDAVTRVDEGEFYTQTEVEKMSKGW